MYIVFDIGATNFRLAHSEDGKTLKKNVIFPTPQNYEDGIKLLTEETQKLLDGQTIQGIAGGVAAQFNQDKTKIIHCSNLPDWSGRAMAEKLSKIFSCPVKLENDCAVGALGESHFGVGKDYKNLIYIAVGTGIGGAWILNKKLVEGSYSFDVGHQVIEANGPICPACKTPGHLEGYIREPNFKKYFAVGLYNTTLHWPSDAVVLGGGAVLKGQWQADEIKLFLNDLTKNRAQNIPILTTMLGDEIGLYGALALITKSVS